MYCACSNARARGTVCDYGGPILAETDGPGGGGGPLVAGDHLFRDMTIGYKSDHSLKLIIYSRHFKLFLCRRTK